MAEKQTDRPVKKINVLILVDHQQYKCGTVVELDEPEAKLLVAEGIADSAISAVNYAKSLI